MAGRLPQTLLDAGSQETDLSPSTMSNMAVRIVVGTVFFLNFHTWGINSVC